MPLSVPPFSFFRTPAPDEMANRLVCAVPEEVREEAYDLLVDNILPVKLAAIDRHPRPQRLTAVVYKDLARRLSSKPPNMRVHMLRLYAFEVFILYMAREALNLAVVRFVLGQSDLEVESLGHWRTAQVTELAMLQSEDIADIASRALESLIDWRDRVVESYPVEWHRHKAQYRIVRSTLEAAVAGSFQRAGGALYDFLCERGKTPEKLD